MASRGPKLLKACNLEDHAVIIARTVSGVTPGELAKPEMSSNSWHRSSTDSVDMASLGLHGQGARRLSLEEALGAVVLEHCYRGNG